MNKATFLVIGDLHIHLNNIDESEILIPTLLEMATNSAPDVIVVLGDVLHTNNNIKSEAHTYATELLEGLSDIAPLLVLMGNHDIPHATSFLSKYHGFNQMKRWVGTKRDNVRFPSTTGVQVVDTTPLLFTVNGRTFGACPYIPPSRFREALDLCEGWKEANAIFCHQELSGCDLGHGEFSHSKDEWDPSYPLIISGHIHKHQIVALNILYVGSPRQVAINEDHYKTISEISFDESGYSEKRISTGLLPRIHFRITPNEIDTIDVPEKGQIKIEITGTISENAVGKRNPKIRLWRRRGFNVKFHNIPDESGEIKISDYGEVNKLGFRGVCRKLAREEGLMEEFNEIFG